MNINILQEEFVKIKNSVFLLDVRNPQEYEFENLGGYLVPLNELPSRLDEIPDDREIVVMCHLGGRSMQATKFLLANGFTNVRNLDGGIDKYAQEIDQKIKRY